MAMIEFKMCAVLMWHPGQAGGQLFAAHLYAPASSTKSIKAIYQSFEKFNHR